MLLKLPILFCRRVPFLGIVDLNTLVVSATNQNNTDMAGWISAIDAGKWSDPEGRGI